MRDACDFVQAVKRDDQATVEELVSEGQDLTRSDDVGQASSATICTSVICLMGIAHFWHGLISKVQMPQSNV